MPSPRERVEQLRAAVGGEPELIALLDVLSDLDEINLKRLAERLETTESEVRTRARRLRHLALASAGSGGVSPGRGTESAHLLDRLADLFDRVPPESLAEADAELQAVGLDPEAVGRRLAGFAAAMLDRGRHAPEPRRNRKTRLHALSASRVVVLAARSDEHAARSEDRTPRWGALARLQVLIGGSVNLVAGEEAVAVEDIEVTQWPVMGRQGTLVIGLRLPRRLSAYGERFCIILVAGDSPAPIGRPIVDARPGQELQASFEISEELQRQWTEKLETPESWPFRLVLSAGRPSHHK